MIQDVYQRHPLIVLVLRCPAFSKLETNAFSVNYSMVVCLVFNFSPTLLFTH